MRASQKASANHQHIEQLQVQDKLAPGHSVLRPAAVALEQMLPAAAA